MSNGEPLEGGFTRIAHDLLEAIMLAPLTKRELLVILAVIRLTYGYGGKKSDTITMWQLSQRTGIRREHVARSVSDLRQKRVLTVHETGTVMRGQFVPAIGMNRHHDEWDFAAKSAPVTVPNSCTVTVPKTGTVGGDVKTVTVPNSGTVTVPNSGTVTVPKSAPTIERKKERKREVRSARTNTAPPNPKNGAGKGTRLTMDFELPAQWVTWCRNECPELNPLAVWPNFRDHWVAKAGPNGLKLDWFATWRNWCRKDAERIAAGRRY